MKEWISIQSKFTIAGILLIVLLSVGCSTSKSTQKRPSTDQPASKDTRPHVYNPSTGKYEPIDDPKEMVDTIWFREDKKVPPIGSTDSRVTGKKALYEVAFLIPFDAARNSTFSSNTDPKVRRFMHYYAGVRMALQELADSGVKIAATVYDTKESPDEAKKIMQGLGNVDAVVGPYESESLQDAALFSSRKKVPVFSPWTPSIPLDTDSPYFIQLTPGLEAHASAIVNFIDTRLPSARVFMVARNDAKEKNRLNLFRDAHAKNKGLTAYEELIIQDASVNLSNTDVTPLIDPEETTVFIMPFFSRNDEDFVNAFLRKLHAEKESASVYVFGMPQWISFSRLSPDYLESANVHVSTAHFVENKDAGVNAFQKHFMETYGTFPEPAAHQGYTLVNYLGKALDKYGTGFLEVVSDRVKLYGDTDYDLVPVYRNPISEKQNEPNFLENQSIRILQFTGHAFRKAE